MDTTLDPPPQFEKMGLISERAANPRGALELEAGWQALCNRYLPTISGEMDSLWRFSRKLSETDPEQGWKLHISATILNANEVFKRIAPFLKSRKVLFKVPLSLLELGKLNSGIYYGYSQIGKFMTVYPRTDEETIELAQKLDQLTQGISAPLIPFDLPYRPDGCIYYRYGAFKYLKIENPDGSHQMAIRNLEGKLVPDEREAVAAKPEWIPNLFPAGEAPSKISIENPLKTKYKIFRALAQRGKGGVYLAIDVSSHLPRLCVIKEGRRNGEIDWEGRDGYWHVKREAKVLDGLKSMESAPQIYDSFELENNFYLVMEYIEGRDLNKSLMDRYRRLSITQALEYSLKICNLVAGIHSFGWVWRDCKPANLIITKDKDIRPIDFEGACLKNEPAFTISGTDGFLSPEWGKDFKARSQTSSDVYALGAVIYYLFTGQFYSNEVPVPVNQIRRNLPPEITKIISKLLRANPRHRLPADKAGRQIKTILERIKKISS